MTIFQFPELQNPDLPDQFYLEGVKQVYQNAIDGINAMPPRGGNMDLSDKDLENLIDYMIKVSK